MLYYSCKPPLYYKSKYFPSFKNIVWLVFPFSFSFLSIFLTINMTHYVLGQDGLLLFHKWGVWFIYFSQYSLTLLGLQAYIMALTFKNSHCSSIIFASLKFTIWEHS